MSIRVNAEVNQGDLAASIAHDPGMLRDNYRGLLDFIVDIDDYVDDLEFTKALHSRLSGIIAECEDDS